MTDLLQACKDGLNISQATTALDGVLNQKIATIQGYLTSVGVSDTVLDSDLAVGTIVLGVTDIWELNGGVAKFSKLFETLAAQLAIRSYANTHAFKVIYDSNGSTSGVPPIDDNVYQQSDTVIILGNLGELEKTGYIYAGWNTKADGSGKDYSDGGYLTIGPADLTLYAKWGAQ